MEKKQEEKLKIACKTRKSFSGPKQGRHPEVELSVLEYFKDLRSRGPPVTRESLQIKAMQVSTSLGLNRKQFKASLGWVRRFMKRNNLSLRKRTTLAQRLPDQFEEKLLQYQRYVIGLRKMHDHVISQIGNADQTPVYFDTPQNSTVETLGRKSILIRSTGYEKARVTVMLAVLGDGWKLPPFVVLRRKTMPKETFPPGIVVRCQEKGWMNNDLVLEWLKTVWANRPGALLNFRGMLALDSFKGHVTDEVKNFVRDLNTDLVIIPGGMTSQLQVLDVVVNKPFKDALRKGYNDWLISNEHAFTPSGKIKKPSCSLLCQWILAAWQAIKPETVRKGFLKCCLTNAMDGTEDDVLWEDSDEEDGRSSVREDSADSSYYDESNESGDD